jgi:WD40 repeat protein
VRWHVDAEGKNAPVHSVDFHDSGVIATGGADNEIHLWDPADESGKNVTVSFVYALKGHQKSINSVRFSPNGECLASAGDGGAVIVWFKGLTTGPEWAWKSISSDRDISRISLRYT